MRLTDFKVLTFDCYGTLIDWESGIAEALRPLATRVNRALTRDEILEAHARYESAQQAYTPTTRYRDLLAIVYKRLAEEWGVAVRWEECVAYGRGIGAWPEFEDSPGALQYLKRYFRLVILSNVDNESFAASNRRLQVAFDAVYTAEDIGSYKPSPRNFQYMIENLARLGVRKEQILHTAESMFHDHAPANQFKLASCWIFRRHNREGFGATMKPDKMPSYNFRFNNLAEMVRAHQEELRS
jgi:2-haloacid dehalogenase